MGKRIWWHWQNLNESGRDWLHGRAWLHIGSRARDGRRCVQASWRIGRWRGLQAMLTRGGCEEDYTVSLGLGFVDLWLILSGFRPYDALPRSWGRDTGLSLNEDHLVLMFNCDDSSWSSKTGPAHGWSKSWFLKDVFLGRAKYTRGEGEPVAAVVSMPEGDYPCTVMLRTDRWDRPRWPWPHTVRRADVEMERPIPFPGKGENSWDCGEDGMYSQTAPASSVEEAVAKAREYVLGRRLRYGGRNWTPKEGAA